MPVTPDPENGFRFLVAIEGIPSLTNIVSVTGPDSVFDVVESQSGGDPTSTPRQLPGLHHLTPIVLQSGLTTDLSLYQWHAAWVAGTQTRRVVVITLLDPTSKPVLKFTLANAWPVRWTAPTLSANSSDIAIQSLELAYEQLDVQAI
jgi:phage tail-like protein